MEFRLPELGEGVNEGELVKWRVAVGDNVAHDQILCEIMTDKATIEIPSPFAGPVTELHHQEGDTVEVDSVLITYSGDGKEEAPVKKEEKKIEKKEVPVAQSTPQSNPPSVTVSAAPVVPSVGGKVSAAPSVRRLAREAGIDLLQVTGTGAGGRVTQSDVQKMIRGGGALAAGAPKFASRQVKPAGGERVIPFKGLRKQIAKKMRESKDKAAHFTYVEEADATALVRLRKQAKELGAAQGVKVTFLPFIMKAMAAALKQHPELNSIVDDENNQIIQKNDFNISLSIQTDDGLTAPVISAVGQKSILEIAAEIQDIVERARKNKLTMDDFKDGTITLTNAGSIGGLFSTPVINYPQVAILGFNKIFRKPVVRNVRGVEKVVIRDWTYFSISLDHRVVDGAIAAEFMKTLIRYVENPSLLLLDTL
ncbi:MAG: hypothetical protein CL678_09445 [Bdellovibrionaceae bacterium]|nr:hypothetical protein [Pseudobdellovibrionaceae bacterium]|tara:strand:+ start:260 stop:1528 length:1269 start_codon:yes stop_codon:yes gene_type:complete